MRKWYSSIFLLNAVLVFVTVLNSSLLAQSQGSQHAAVLVPDSTVERAQDKGMWVLKRIGRKDFRKTLLGSGRNELCAARYLDVNPKPARVEAFCRNEGLSFEIILVENHRAEDWSPDMSFPLRVS